MTTPQPPQTYADVVQHTQGPWRVSGAALDGFRPIMAPGGVIVALVSTIAGNHADRQVIAAAPDLLAFAEWVSYHYENQDMNHVDFRVEAKRRADAALAKATTESTPDV